MDYSEKNGAMEFMSLSKEMDDIYHDVALKIGMSDSALTIFYSIYRLGDGCLQRDICQHSYTNKQTINSAIRKLEADGYLYLEQGKGRDKHIYLTAQGKQILHDKARPIADAEDGAFLALSQKEQQQFVSAYQKYLNEFRKRAEKL